MKCIISFMNIKKYKLWSEGRRKVLYLLRKFSLTFYTICLFRWIDGSWYNREILLHLSLRPDGMCAYIYICIYVELRLKRRIQLSSTVSPDEANPFSWGGRASRRSLSSVHINSTFEINKRYTLCGRISGDSRRKKFLSFRLYIGGGGGGLSRHASPAVFIFA